MLLGTAVLPVGGLQQHRATAAGCFLPNPRAASEGLSTCCSSPEAKCRAVAGRAALRGHHCPRAGRTAPFLEVLLPEQCGPGPCWAGEQTARMRPAQPGPARGQGGAEGSPGRQRTPWEQLGQRPLPSPSAAPAGVSPPQGVYKAQLMSVWRVPSEWQRCSGSALPLYLF